MALTPELFESKFLDTRFKSNAKTQKQQKTKGGLFGGWISSGHKKTLKNQGFRKISGEREGFERQKYNFCTIKSSTGRTPPFRG